MEFALYALTEAEQICKDTLVLIKQKLNFSERRREYDGLFGYYLFLCLGHCTANSLRLNFERRNNMAVHHGGKVGKAAKVLASKSSSPKAKSVAGKTLANHKAKYH